MKLFLYLGIGGAVGTWARYLLQGVVQPAGGTFPWGTLVVNVVGAFALGFLMRYLLGSSGAGPEVRAGLTIGLCGAFTTMSTFSYETVALLEDGEYFRIGGYVSATLLGGVAAVLAGIALANRLL